MSETLHVKRGDVGRQFTDTLTTGDPAVPIDLTDAVEVLFQLDHTERALVVTGVATVVGDPTDGNVEYTTVATNLDIAGLYRHEWQVTFSDGTIFTFPDEGYNYVSVDMDLGPADEADTQGTAGSGDTCGPWATIANFDDYDANPTDVLDALQLATDVLFHLTGRRYTGVCTDAYRPTGCACARRDEHCWGPPQIRLPNFPAVAITSVTIDGDVLGAENYRLDDGRFLVRLDGDAWPCCQDMRLAVTEDRTMQIVYTYGVAPPVGGKRAAIALAREYLYAWAPDQAVRAKCRLPKRVTNISRQGETMVLIDPLDLIEKGMTGIAEVDQWVGALRTGDARRPSTVLVPGQRRSSRRTT